MHLQSDIENCLPDVLHDLTHCLHLTVEQDCCLSHAVINGVNTKIIKSIFFIFNLFILQKTLKLTRLYWLILASAQIK